MPNATQMPWWRRPIVLGIFFLVIVYLAGGGWAAFLLYKQNKTEGPIRFLAHIYPLPVARVGSQFVYPSGFLTIVHSGISYQKTDPKAVADPTELKKSVLTTLVQEAIVSQEARAQHVVVTDQEVNDSYNSLADDGGGRTVFEEVLHKLYGLSPQQFSDLRVLPAVQEKKLRESAFVQYHLRLIANRDQKKLQDIVNTINGGADFVDQAKKNSQDDKTRDNGGDIGFVNHETVAQNYGDDVEKAIFVGKQGDVVGPVKSKDNVWLALKIEEVKGLINARFDAWLADKLAHTKIWKLY